jgi:hypothetical protein
MYATTRADIAKTDWEVNMKVLWILVSLLLTVTASAQQRPDSVPALSAALSLLQIGDFVSVRTEAFSAEVRVYRVVRVATDRYGSYILMDSCKLHEQGGRIELDDADHLKRLVVRRIQIWKPPFTQWQALRDQCEYQ